MGLVRLLRAPGMRRMRLRGLGRIRGGLLGLWYVFNCRRLLDGLSLNVGFGLLMFTF